MYLMWKSQFQIAAISSFIDRFSKVIAQKIANEQQNMIHITTPRQKPCHYYGNHTYLARAELRSRRYCYSLLGLLAEIKVQYLLSHTMITIVLLEHLKTMCIYAVLVNQQCISASPSCAQFACHPCAGAMYFTLFSASKKALLGKIIFFIIKLYVSVGSSVFNSQISVVVSVRRKLVSFVTYASRFTYF